MKCTVLKKTSKGADSRDFSEKKEALINLKLYRTAVKMKTMQLLISFRHVF